METETINQNVLYTGMDMSQSVAERYRQKYPPSQQPRFDPHAAQLRMNEERASLEREMEIMGWSGSPLGSMPGASSSKAAARPQRSGMSNLMSHQLIKPAENRNMQDPFAEQEQQAKPNIKQYKEFMENMYYVQSEQSKVNTRKRIAKTHVRSSNVSRGRDAGFLALRKYEQATADNAGGAGFGRPLPISPHPDSAEILPPRQHMDPLGIDNIGASSRPSAWHRSGPQSLALEPVIGAPGLLASDLLALFDDASIKNKKESVDRMFRRRRELEDEILAQILLREEASQTIDDTTLGAASWSPYNTTGLEQVLCSTAEGSPGATIAQYKAGTVPKNQGMQNPRKPARQALLTRHTEDKQQFKAFQHSRKDRSTYRSPKAGRQFGNADSEPEGFLGVDQRTTTVGLSSRVQPRSFNERAPRAHLLQAGKPRRPHEPRLKDDSFGIGRKASAKPSTTTKQPEDRKEVKIRSHADRANRGPGVSEHRQLQSSYEPSEFITNLLQDQHQTGEELVLAEAKETNKMQLENGQSRIEASTAFFKALRGQRQAEDLNSVMVGQQVLQMKAKEASSNGNLNSRERQGSPWGRASLASGAGGGLGPLRRSADAADDLSQRGSPQVPFSVEGSRGPNADGITELPLSNGAEQLHFNHKTGSKGVRASLGDQAETDRSLPKRHRYQPVVKGGFVQSNRTLNLLGSRSKSGERSDRATNTNKQGPGLETKASDFNSGQLLTPTIIPSMEIKFKQQWDILPAKLAPRLTGGHRRSMGFNQSGSGECGHGMALSPGNRKIGGAPWNCASCKSPGSPAGARHFSTLPLSQAKIKSKAQLLSNESHYEQVFERVKSRHERKRLKLPAGFLRQQKHYQNQQVSIDSQVRQNQPQATSNTKLNAPVQRKQPNPGQDPQDLTAAKHISSSQKGGPFMYKTTQFRPTTSEEGPGASGLRGQDVRSRAGVPASGGGDRKTKGGTLQAQSRIRSTRQGQRAGLNQRKSPAGRVFSAETTVRALPFGAYATTTPRKSYSGAEEGRILRKGRGPKFVSSTRSSNLGLPHHSGAEDPCRQSSTTPVLEPHPNSSIAQPATGFQYDKSQDRKRQTTAAHPRLSSGAPNDRLCNQVRMKTISPQSMHNTNNIKTSYQSEHASLHFQAQAQLAFAKSAERGLALAQDENYLPQGPDSQSQVYGRQMRQLGLSVEHGKSGIYNIGNLGAGFDSGALNCPFEPAQSLRATYQRRQQILATTNERYLDLKSLNAKKKRLEGLSLQHQDICQIQCAPKTHTAGHERFTSSTMSLSLLKYTHGKAGFARYLQDGQGSKQSGPLNILVAQEEPKSREEFGQFYQERDGTSNAARLETAETKVRNTEHITVAEEPRSVVASHRSVLFGNEDGLSPAGVVTVGSDSSPRIASDGGRRTTSKTKQLAKRHSERIGGEAEADCEVNQDLTKSAASSSLQGPQGSTLSRIKLNREQQIV